VAELLSRCGLPDGRRRPPQAVENLLLNEVSKASCIVIARSARPGPVDAVQRRARARSPLRLFQNPRPLGE
jgi:hypothetical protein